MTSINLAARNVKKSIRDYTIYFLTLTFGVCIFYIFNALESQQTMMEITQSQAEIFKLLGNIMSSVSVFISFILGFLIVYANRFLIKRRKKEFGVYMTLGMEKGKISRVLIMETLLVGLFALLFGLLLGALLSQGMALVTSNLLGATVTNFRFVFSLSAVIKTAIYFGLVFLLVMIFNTITVSKQKLINLLYANRKNESFRTPRLLLSVVLFLISLCFLGYAYFIMLSGGVSAMFDSKPLLLSVLLGMAGTFLFFFSLSGFFLKLIQQSKTLYLKNLNMFILRQINSKINTTYVSISLVCMMLFISICTLSSGMGLSSAISGEMKKNAPFDVSFSAYAKTDENSKAISNYPGVDFIDVAQKQDVALSSFAKESLTVRYYDAGFSIPLRVVENGFEVVIDMQACILKLSDYNKVLAFQGVSPLSLAENEYAVNFAVTNAAFRKAMQEYLKESNTVILGGETLQTVSERFYTRTLEVSRNQDYNINIIVNDALISDLPSFRDVLHINYPGPTEAYDKLCMDSLAKLNFEENIETTLQTKSEVQDVNNSAITIVSYLAVYLGIIFLIAAAAVLAIGQLSETSDNTGRYGLLHKLGTEESMIKQALFAQIAIYFGAPMLLALVHSIVGITVASNVVSTFDKGNILGGSLFTAAAILTIYGGYFLATYVGSKNILNRDCAQLKNRVE
ncbi:MAG: FtsX-like permease family protein [Clostridiales bacterium]|jgi:putative ABC transport system permease protein|nr:FtsX-like permease family protein [Clostridiales bacterium]